MINRIPTFHVRCCPLQIGELVGDEDESSGNLAATVYLSVRAIMYCIWIKPVKIWTSSPTYIKGVRT